MSVPDFLIVVCDFPPKKRSRPGEEREFLCGRRLTNRRGVPERVEERVGESTYPIYFALIKNPVKVGGRTYNAAIGAITIYRLATAKPEVYEKIKAATVEELRKRYRYFMLIAGREEFST